MMWTALFDPVGIGPMSTDDWSMLIYWDWLENYKGVRQPHHEDDWMWGRSFKVTLP